VQLLITGAGTLAQALLERYPDAVLLTRGEYSVQRLRWRRPDVRAVIGDVRQTDLVYRAIVESGAERVVHTAAMKQVGASGANAIECASVNVDGTAAVVRACQQAGVPLLFTSSDKAVEPLNTYGKAKALAEDIVLGAGYTVTRWGNIIRSRGSVLERWERTGQIVVTDLAWTRFWLTRDEAAAFVESVLGMDGRLHVRMSKAASMGDLARAAQLAMRNPTCDERLNAAAPGEKPHERLALDHAHSGEAPRYSVDELTEMIMRDMARWPL
jgi:FlaA1/EpsC-like NDP-sugar epimerase